MTDESHIAHALRQAQGLKPSPQASQGLDALRLAQGLKPQPQPLDVTRLRQARRMFCHPLAPRTVQRHNMKSWVKSLRQLGDKWLLARR